MRLTITIDDTELQAYIARLRKDAPRRFGAVVQALAAQGRELARDNVTHQIYATPERGGYRRTRFLIRSIYGEARMTATGGTVTLGAAAGYAAYNEFGTYDGFDLLGEPPEDNLLEYARWVKGDIRMLEFGNVAKGLEPRPFLIPALVQLERIAPGMIREAFRRMARE